MGTLDPPPPPLGWTEVGLNGMGGGGLSVSGIGRHRKEFAPFLPEVDHLPHTLSHEHAAFSRGQPQWGAHLADELEALAAIPDPSSIAAVIVVILVANAVYLVLTKRSELKTDIGLEAFGAARRSITTTRSRRSSMAKPATRPSGGTSACALIMADRMTHCGLPQRWRSSRPARPRCGTDQRRPGRRQ